MFLSLWVFTSCTKPPVPTVETPPISVSLPDIDRDIDTIPIPEAEQTLNNINTQWLNHPEWHWIEYDIQKTQYSQQSEWMKDTVKVWSQTPCQDSAIQWYNPSTGETGTTTHDTGDFWVTQPYAKHHRGIQLVLSCGEWSSSLQWHKREHSTFPKIELISTDVELNLQVLHGQYHQLHLEFRRNEQWIPIETVIITSPLMQIRLNKPTEQTEIRWHLTPFDSTSRPILSDSLTHSTQEVSTTIEDISIQFASVIIHQGDILATTHVTRRDSVLAETQTWIVGTQSNSAPLPSDQIGGVWVKEGFLQTQKTFTLPQLSKPAPLPTEIRMDTQVSDERLTLLIPLLYAPDNADTLATRLYFSALYWDALSDRRLPWTQSLLDQSHHAIQYFNNITSDMWQQWPFKIQMKVLLAVLASERNGQTISTKSMHLLLNALCELPGADIPKDAALMSHIQWLVKETSLWRHLACPISNPIPIWSNPKFQDEAIETQHQIQDAITEWIEPDLPPIEDVYSWWQWQYETEVNKRYTNLNLSLMQNGDTQRGLFHEWQFKPIRTSVPSDQFIDLTISGVGRLYLSEWQFAQGTLKPLEQDELKIRRTIQTPNTDTLDLKQLNLGQELRIEYQIQSLPNSRVCLTEWNASGLSAISNHEQQCMVTDSSGFKTIHRTVWVMFDGRFKLPAALISNGKQLAHTEDLWLQTIDFSSRSRNSKNMIQ